MKHVLNNFAKTKLNKTEFGLAGAAIAAILALPADPNVKAVCVAAIAIAYAFSRGIAKGLGALTDKVTAPEPEETEL